MAEDELAARRLPDWAKKLAEIKLGASFAIGVMPLPQWVEENPGVAATECPEHLLYVSVAIMGSELQPPSMLDPHRNPNPATWPSVTFPIHEICRVPWNQWRTTADLAFAAQKGEAVGA